MTEHVAVDRKHPSASVKKEDAMADKETLDIDVFKAVTRAIAQSDQLDLMADHLTRLLVGALGIKGCTIFALDIDTDELEILATFGLSAEYVNKGPVLSAKSLRRSRGGEPVIISDIEASDQLQYPENALAEGIRAIVSIPIKIYDRVIGDVRLYHSAPWAVSDNDVDSLMLLGELVGLAMQYTRVLNALQAVRDTIDDVHSVWLNP